MKTRTAMQEVRDIVLKGRLDGNSDKQIVDFICLFFPDAIEKEKQQIIEARALAPILSATDIKEYYKEATDYFTQKYEQ